MSFFLFDKRNESTIKINIVVRGVPSCTGSYVLINIMTHFTLALMYLFNRIILLRCILLLMIKKILIYVSRKSPVLTSLFWLKLNWLKPDATSQIVTWADRQKHRNSFKLILCSEVWAISSVTNFEDCLSITEMSINYEDKRRGIEEWQT